MNHIKIIGMGEKLPANKIDFAGMTRYRIQNDESQMTLAVGAVNEALKNSNMTIDQVDVIVSACSIPTQLIPNMSALIHEKIAIGLDIPCIDINTTCTSFISALDTMSYLLEARRYKNVLIVSSEVPSLALNEKQAKSYELFSDCAVAMLVALDESKSSGMQFALQKTYSEGAHYTEIKGGGTGYLPTLHDGLNSDMYKFDMKGKKAIKLTKSKLIPFIDEIKSSIDVKIDYVIPHQASLVLDSLMKKIGFNENEFLSIVKSHGNMVAASIPFGLKYAIESKKIKRGDNILLVGTAAGLHLNGLVLKY